MSAKNIMWSRK